MEPSWSLVTGAKLQSWGFYRLCLSEIGLLFAISNTVMRASDNTLPKLFTVGGIESCIQNCALFPLVWLEGMYLSCATLWIFFFFF